MLLKYLSFLMVCAAAMPALGSATPPNADELFTAFRARLAAINAYEMTMTKQQRIDGKLLPQETIFLKQSRAPRCVYMKWITRPHKGREVIHCAQRYGGKLKVHAGGRLNLPVLSLDPHGALAMRNNLHPISSAGLFELEKATDQAQNGTLEMQQVAGRSVPCLVSRNRIDLGPYVAARQELCVDPNTHLPVQLKLWNDANALMEHYTYRDHRTHQTLNRRDFDVLNPRYGF